MKASVKTIRRKVSSSWNRKGNIFTENIALPVNSCAKVYIPIFNMESAIVKDNTVLWQNGLLIGSISGAIFNGITDGYITWNVGSGEYSFTIIG